MSSKKTATIAATLNVKQIYADLQKCEASRDYDRGLRDCNRLLKLKTDDSIALQCKVTCLIQLNKFEDALQTIKKCSSAMQSAFVFEKAYCEYRLNRTDEALKTLFDSSVQDFRCRELLAQLLYRQENYEECYNVYSSLLKDSQDEYDDERQVNLSAVSAHLAIAGQTIDDTFQQDTRNSYELAFNQSCQLLAQLRLDEAEKKLKKSETICRKTFEDEDELEEELSCIRTQLAYINHLRGNTDDAADVYNDIIKQRSADVAITAVACNNLVAARKDQNLFDSRKKIKSCMSKDIIQKLSSWQQQAIVYNNALLQLHGNQLELCRSAVNELMDLSKNRLSVVEDVVLLKAALLVREKQFAKAEDILKSHMLENVDYSVRISLTLANIFLFDSKPLPAVECLQNDNRLAFEPAIVSWCVAVSGDNFQKKATVIDGAIVHHQKCKNINTLAILLEEAGKLYLSAGDHRAASEKLEKLHKLKPNDVQILARLIKAYSQYDESKAEQLSSKAGDAGQLSEDIDVEALESSSWLIFGQKYSQKKAKQRETDGQQQLTTKKHKRKHKVKLPKNFDAAIPPDPERWLPKFERSTFKRKKTKKDREREMGKGTQGIANPDNVLDSSIKPLTPASPKIVAEPKPSPQAPTVQGPRKQQPLKKKKKGASKW